MPNNPSARLPALSPFTRGVLYKEIPEYEYCGYESRRMWHLESAQGQNSIWWHRLFRSTLKQWVWLISNVFHLRTKNRMERNVCKEPNTKKVLMMKERKNRFWWYVHIYTYRFHWWKDWNHLCIFGRDKSLTLVDNYVCIFASDSKSSLCWREAIHFTKFVLTIEVQFL